MHKLFVKNNKKRYNIIATWLQKNLSLALKLATIISSNDLEILIVEVVYAYYFIYNKHYI